MARPREFETDTALERAMQVFWQHGYRDASLPDLLEGMGLTRGSLYKAFKDKKNLFLLVLERYETAHVDSAVALLSNPALPDGRDRILKAFESILAAVQHGDHRGCLLCTAAGNAAAEDPDIATVVQDGLEKMRGGFETALNAMPELQQMDAPAITAMSDVLLTQYIGLRMLARSRLDLGVLDRSVKGIDAILRGAFYSVFDLT